MIALWVSVLLRLLITYTAVRNSLFSLHLLEVFYWYYVLIYRLICLQGQVAVVTQLSVVIKCKRQFLSFPHCNKRIIYRFQDLPGVSLIQQVCEHAIVHYQVICQRTSQGRILAVPYLYLNLFYMELLTGQSHMGIAALCIGVLRIYLQYFGESLAYVGFVFYTRSIMVPGQLTQYRYSYLCSHLASGGIQPLLVVHIAVLL